MKDSQNYVIKLEQPEVKWEDIGKSFVIVAGALFIGGTAAKHFVDDFEMPFKEKIGHLSLKELNKAINDPSWDRLKPLEQMQLLRERQKREIAGEEEAEELILLTVEVPDGADEETITKHVKKAVKKASGKKPKKKKTA